MSLEKARLIYERGVRYYRISEIALNNYFYDVCATNSHISAELLIKSVFLLLNKEPPYYSFHSVRKLLSELSLHTLEFREEILRVTREKRQELKALDSCRSNGQYLEKEIDSTLALTCFKTLKEVIIPLVNKVWKNQINIS